MSQDRLVGSSRRVHCWPSQSAHGTLLLLATFVLPALVLPVLNGCDVAGLPIGEPSAADDSIATILTVNVTRAALSKNAAQTASSFGTIEPKRSSSLGFARGGRVTKVLFDVGDFVVEGDKIAEVDQGQLVNQQEDLDNVLKAQQEELALLESQSDVQRARRKQEEIAELTAQQERLTRELQKGIIVAPYRGVIAERNAEVGDFVPAGRPYFRILDDAQPIVELNVPAKIAKQLEVGQGVWVRRNESVLPAKVATIAPTLNQSSRTQLLTLNTISAAETADWAFGEVVEVHFWLPTENTGFWLPYSALQREVSGLWSTYVLAAADDAQIADNPINARIVERRIVEILQLEDTHALVRGAIDEGDLVIVDGLNRIVPGQKVKPNVLTREYQQSVPQGAGA